MCSSVDNGDGPLLQATYISNLERCETDVWSSFYSWLSFCPFRYQFVLRNPLFMLRPPEPWPLVTSGPLPMVFYKFFIGSQNFIRPNPYDKLLITIIYSVSISLIKFNWYSWGNLKTRRGSWVAHVFSKKSLGMLWLSVIRKNDQ